MLQIQGLERRALPQGSVPRRARQRGAPLGLYRARLDEAGEGTWIAAFQVDDLAGAARLLSRRGLDVESIGTVVRVKAAGLQFVLTPGRVGAQPSPPTEAENAAVAALDHVVVHTPNPDRNLTANGRQIPGA